MNPVTVLPLDDQEYVREVLEVTGLLMLEPAHATAALANAANARSSIDLLLTDVDMPGVDGVELAAASGSSTRRLESGTCPDPIWTRSRREATRSRMAS